jgi:hypothetical protein
MSDEETIATDGVGLDGATGEDSGAPETPPEAPETVEKVAKTDEKPEPTGLDKLASKAKEVIEKGVETPVLEGKPAPFTPNLKFKVMDKEHEIPKEFQGMIKDEKSEKMVRELHEKALGLDIVKQKFNETREEKNSLIAENTEIKRSIDGLRTVVQGAIKSGNLLKLDDFFSKLQIPEEVIMKYALQKVQFAELPPEQRQILEANMSAEKRAEMLQAQYEDSQSQVATQAQEMKAQMLEHTLAREDIRAVAQDWDTKVGKPGSFKALVAQVGHLAWLQSDGKVDLTPEQAVQEVMRGYGLQAPTAAAPGNATPAPGTPAPAQKRVIQRTTNTIPNVQGRSSSPLKAKPKSIDDLKKLYKEYGQAEA